MSIRIIASISPNIYSARAFTVSVLPTPVGPKNINEPVGCFAEATPVLDLLITFANAFTARSWPMIELLICSAIALIIFISSVPKRVTGIPVCIDTVSAISSIVTVLFCVFSVDSHFSVSSSTFASKLICSSLSAAATS